MERQNAWHASMVMVFEAKVARGSARGLVSFAQPRYCQSDLADGDGATEMVEDVVDATDEVELVVAAADEVVAGEVVATEEVVPAELTELSALLELAEEVVAAGEVVPDEVMATDDVELVAIDGSELAEVELVVIAGDVVASLVVEEVGATDETVEDVVEGATELVTGSLSLYSVKPTGPPQYCSLSPAHNILHLPSVAGLLPSVNVLPQKHSFAYSTAKYL